jgi:tRNA pseudouridine38-40 synthase
VVQGNGFLYNQVRAIAGTLQQVGTRKIVPQRMLEILESKDRREAGMTAPACGLYLVRVLYPRDALGSHDTPLARNDEKGTV